MKPVNKRELLAGSIAALGIVLVGIGWFITNGFEGARGYFVGSDNDDGSSDGDPDSDESVTLRAIEWVRG